MYICQFDILTPCAKFKYSKNIKVIQQYEKHDAKHPKWLFKYKKEGLEL